MFPNATALKFFEKMFSYTEQTVFAGDIAAALSAALRMVSYLQAYNYIDICKPLQVTDLSHLSLAGERLADNGTELVRRNAASLVALSLEGAGRAACVDMIQTSDGALVTYPRLRKLNITLDHGTCGSTKPRTSPALGVPFPVLEQLSVIGAYPFTNDILLRGNNVTLNSLELYIDGRSLRAIDERRVLDLSRYPRLERLLIRCGTVIHFARDNNPMGLMGFARITMPVGAQEANAEEPGLPSNRFLIDSIPLSSASSQIRVLHVCGIPLTVLEIVQVLQHLPNIIRLECGLMHENPGSKALPSSKEISAFYDSHYPLGIHLRHWGIRSRQGLTPKQVAERIPAVAILVPSLKSINVSLFLGRNFSRFFKEAIRWWNYKLHYDRLSSLELDYQRPAI
ncbi:hypothetical protein GQ54DRAFT_65916 [Martensiomyces pterosporus]|nr:hypothetical protein GQ54DRAFT_65916 [Martensiomyces pterosporus]